MTSHEDRRIEKASRDTNRPRLIGQIYALLKAHGKQGLKLGTIVENTVHYLTGGAEVLEELGILQKHDLAHQVAVAGEIRYCAGVPNDAFPQSRVVQIIPVGAPHVAVDAPNREASDVVCWGLLESGAVVPMIGNADYGCIVQARREAVPGRASEHEFEDEDDAFERAQAARWAAIEEEPDLFDYLGAIRRGEEDENEGAFLEASDDDLAVDLPTLAEAVGLAVDDLRRVIEPFRSDGPVWHHGEWRPNAVRLAFFECRGGRTESAAAE